MIWLHVLAGALGLISGAVAMSAPKGGALHRKSGIVFVCSMLYMSAGGTVMASMMTKPGTTVTVLVGALTFYLVATGFLTMRLPVERARGWIIGFMLLALSIAALGMTYGLMAVSSIEGRLNGLPGAVYFVFAGIALLAAGLDGRMLLAGSIQGAQRLARHLWRMSFAMFIASFSFFFGQSRKFPEPIRESGVLMIPIVLVLLFLVYWLVRVLWKRRRVAVLTHQT